MTDIYIVIYDDRHVDTDALPFSTQEAAIAYAEKCLAESARYPEAIEKTVYDEPDSDGWVWFARYSEEGDTITVVHRVLDGAV